MLLCVCLFVLNAYCRPMLVVVDVCVSFVVVCCCVLVVVVRVRLLFCLVVVLRRVPIVVRFLCSLHVVS